MSWIRDLFGIKKDIEETKKIKLEMEELVKKLSDIKIANFDQIKEYDEKYKCIEQKITIEGSANVVGGDRVFVTRMVKEKERFRKIDLIAEIFIILIILFFLVFIIIKTFP